MNEENQQTARLTKTESKLIQFFRNLTEDEKLMLIEKSKEYSTTDNEKNKNAPTD